MIDDSKQIAMDEKNARIILAMSEMFNLSLERAADIFYNSQTSQLIQDKVADLQCRSEKYLAGEVMREYRETIQHGHCDL